MALYIALNGCCLIKKGAEDSLSWGKTGPAMSVFIGLGLWDTEGSKLHKFGPAMIGTGHCQHTFVKHLCSFVGA